MEDQLTTPLGFLYEADKPVFQSAQSFPDLVRLAQIHDEQNEYLRVVVVNKKEQTWFVLFDSEGFLCATRFPNKALRLCAMESQNTGSCRRWLNRPAWIPPTATTRSVASQHPSLPSLSLSDLDL